MRSRERRSPRPVTAGTGTKSADQAGKQVAPFIAPTGDQRKDGLPSGPITLAEAGKRYWAFAVLPGDDCPPLIVIPTTENIVTRAKLIRDDGIPMLTFVDGPDGLRVVPRKPHRVY